MESTPAGDRATCPFCEILAGTVPGEILWEGTDSIVLVPLGAVTPGHVLVVPRRHVSDVCDDPDVSASTMRDAALWARDLGPVNIITSRGREATQSVFHLHLHVVPRRANDGLALPWYSGRSRH